MNFLKQLLQQGCAHRFSWPRISDDGRHYQICLACGTAYEYDWRMMRQTGRLLAAAVVGHDLAEHGLAEHRLAEHGLRERALGENNLRAARLFH